MYMQKLGPHHKKFIEIYQKAITKLKIIYRRILKRKELKHTKKPSKHKRKIRKTTQKRTTILTGKQGLTWQ